MRAWNDTSDPQTRSWQAFRSATEELTNTTPLYFINQSGDTTMLHQATSGQERDFMRTRQVGAGTLTKSIFDALDTIINSKNTAAQCPHCGSDPYFTERGNSYAVWCAHHLDCGIGYVVRGI